MNDNVNHISLFKFRSGGGTFKVRVQGEGEGEYPMNDTEMNRHDKTK